jgi:predicted RNA-binding Zn ribbon-like protein
MWPATARYGIKEAPLGLAIVQDFLNTRPIDRPDVADLLGSVDSTQMWADAALRAWSKTTGRRVATPRIGATDMRELQQLRATVEHRLQDPAARLGTVESPVSAQLGADGQVLLQPAGTGWRVVASAVLIEAGRAQQADVWRRLKVCRNEICRCAFYDTSKNNSAVWHSATVCGNAHNLRASRARRSQG